MDLTGILEKSNRKTSESHLTEVSSNPIGSPFLTHSNSKRLRPWPVTLTWHSNMAASPSSTTTDTGSDTKRNSWNFGEAPGGKWIIHWLDINIDAYQYRFEIVRQTIHKMVKNINFGKRNKWIKIVLLEVIFSKTYVPSKNKILFKKQNIGEKQSIGEKNFHKYHISKN